MKNIKLSPEQNYVLKQMKSGKRVAISGGAGTGKTTLLLAFKEHCKETKKKVVFLSPTGMASKILDGSTIHSFFKMRPEVWQRDKLPKIGRSQQKLINRADIIVIDEISMVRSDTFHGIEQTINHCSGSVLRHLAFAGKQVIICGDLYQLTPIGGGWVNEKYILNNYDSLFAFNTKAWESLKFDYFELTTVHRQSQDKLFIDLLNAIRVGDVHSVASWEKQEGEEQPLSVVDTFNKHCTVAPTIPRKGVMVLCPTNRQVEHINMIAESSLLGKTYKLKAMITGIFNKKSCPAPETLEIKVGSRVQIVANKYAQGPQDSRYFNGEQGAVEAVDPESGWISVCLDCGRKVHVRQHEWVEQEYELVNDSYSGQERISQKDVGFCSQYPLRLCYAMTYHKSQGQSYDRVHLELDGGKMNAGMLYVGLSRCRTLEGLTVSRKLKLTDIKVNSEVLEFYDSIDGNIYRYNELSSSTANDLITGPHF